MLAIMEWIIWQLLNYVQVIRLFFYTVNYKYETHKDDMRRKTIEKRVVKTRPVYII